MAGKHHSRLARGRAIIATGKTQESGFTLVELALVLSVMALLVGTSISVGSARVETTKIQATQERIMLIKVALTEFVKKYGYLPCPSDPTMSEDDDDYGRGLGTGEDTGGCTATNLLRSGSVVAGAVPNITMNLSPNVAIDGWEHRITYVVDEDMTNQQDFEDNTPGIEIQGASAMIVNDAAFVLISHGKNGHGSWSGKGGATRLDTGSADVAETENSHLSTAYDNQFVQKPATLTFDDLVEYMTKWQF